MAAASPDCIDERAFRGAIFAEHIPRQVLDLRATASHAAGLPGASEAVLTPQHAVDLLRFEACELFRCNPGAIEAQRCDFASYRLSIAKAAVGMLGVEHRQHAGDAIAR